MTSIKKVSHLAMSAAITFSMAATPAHASTSSLFQVQPIKGGFLLASAKTQKKSPESNPGGNACQAESHAKDCTCSDQDKASKVREGKCGEGVCGANMHPVKKSDCQGESRSKDCVAGNKAMNKNSPEFLCGATLPPKKDRKN